MDRRTASLALAGSVMAALSLAAAAGPATAADDKEKCFGISMAGKNDCASAGNNSCAGTAKRDFEKAAWKYVPKGSCVSMEVTLPDDSKRMGSLEPAKG